MHCWFAYLFEKRMNSEHEVCCFECGKPLHESIYKELSCCYSHILSKNIYPQFKGEEWNVKICCCDCHNLYTMQPKKAIRQYNEYIKLKQERL